jgi:hypothetical protein
MELLQQKSLETKLLALFQHIVAGNDINVKKLCDTLGVVFRPHNFYRRTPKHFLKPDWHITWLGAIYLITTFQMGKLNWIKKEIWSLVDGRIQYIATNSSK